MTIKRETYNIFNQLISTIIIAPVKAKTFAEFAQERGGTVERGARSFTVKTKDVKIKYTRI